MRVGVANALDSGPSTRSSCPQEALIVKILA
jgi:hypothetical protein